METTIDKQELINWIDDLEDEALLATLQSIKESASDGDFWRALPDEVRQAINKGQKQLEEGKGIPHEEVRRKIKERFLQ